jgi:hypothetical protein
MNASTHYKICPRCQQKAALEATTCANCCRQYNTKFEPPPLDEKTQFAAAPVLKPLASFDPQPSYQQPMLPPVPPVGVPDTGVNPTMALVLGLVGLLAWIIPLFGLPTSATGLGLGITAYRSGNRGGMVITALVLCSLGLLFGIGNAAVGAYLGVRGELPWQKNRSSFPEPLRAREIMPNPGYQPMPGYQPNPGYHPMPTAPSMPPMPQMPAMPSGQWGPLPPHGFGSPSHPFLRPPVPPPFPAFGHARGDFPRGDFPMPGYQNGR